MTKVTQNLLHSSNAPSVNVEAESTSWKKKLYAIGFIALSTLIGYFNLSHYGEVPNISTEKNFSPLISTPNFFENFNTCPISQPSLIPPQFTKEYVIPYEAKPSFLHCLGDRNLQRKIIDSLQDLTLIPHEYYVGMYLLKADNQTIGVYDMRGNSRHNVGAYAAMLIDSGGFFGVPKAADMDFGLPPTFEEELREGLVTEYIAPCPYIEPIYKEFKDYKIVVDYVLKDKTSVPINLESFQKLAILQCLIQNIDGHAKNMVPQFDKSTQSVFLTPVDFDLAMRFYSNFDLRSSSKNFSKIAQSLLSISNGRTPFWDSAYYNEMLIQPLTADVKKWIKQFDPQKTLSPLCQLEGFDEALIDGTRLRTMALKFGVKHNLSLLETYNYMSEHMIKAIEAAHKLTHFYYKRKLGNSFLDSVSDAQLKKTFFSYVKNFIDNTDRNSIGNKTRIKKKLAELKNEVVRSDTWSDWFFNLLN